MLTKFFILYSFGDSYSKCDTTRPTSALVITSCPPLTTQGVTDVTTMGALTTPSKPGGGSGGDSDSDDGSSGGGGGNSNGGNFVQAPISHSIRLPGRTG